MMLWTDEPCCIFTLFFLMRILSLQLYTWIQPSSVPSHIVGCKLSVSSVTMDVSHTSESDALRIRFGSSWTPMLIPVPGIPSSPSSSSSLEELLEIQRPHHTCENACYTSRLSNLRGGPNVSRYMKTETFLIWEIKCKEVILNKKQQITMNNFTIWGDILKQPAYCYYHGLKCLYLKHKDKWVAKYHL